MKLQTRNRLIAVTLALAGTAGVARAAEPSPEAEQETLTVRVGDLDLRTDAGATHAFFRLRDAAETVCGDDGTARPDLFRRAEFLGCEQKALAPAVQRLHSPALTAIYDRRFHVSQG